MTPSTSVVVPVYNSQESLPELVRRLKAVLTPLTPRYEILLVNDGSRDHSWEVISELIETSTSVQGINLMRNYGQHNALLCGIRAAQYDLIVTLDDDLQHPPEEIPKLLEKLSEGYDVVYGTPRQRQHEGWRNLTSLLIRMTLQIVIKNDIARHISSFRVFRTQLREAFANYHSQVVLIDALLTWGTMRFAAVPIQHEPRSIGKSNYTLYKLVIMARNVITGFSTFPLRLASIIGFFFMLFGVGVLGYVIGRYYMPGYSMPDYPFLASVIAIFSGEQLFALGIIGEYLGQIHFRSMARPPYTIHATTVQC
jgi:glycosyltransferase involved in cell wall biosynthesis